MQVVLRDGHPADDQRVTHATSPVPTTTSIRTITRPTFSPELFDRLWTIHDIAGFADISERAAWALMAGEAAPARLHLGARTIRWDPTAVIAFLLGRTGAVEATQAPAPATGRARLTVVPDRASVTVIAPDTARAASPAAKPRPVARAMRRGTR